MHVKEAFPAYIVIGVSVDFGGSIFKRYWLERHDVTAPTLISIVSDVSREISVSPILSTFLME